MEECKNLYFKYLKYYNTVFKKLTREHMKIGCCAYSYRQYLLSGKMNLKEFIDTAAAIGVDGVELTSYYFPSTKINYLNEIKRHCLKKGIAISGAAMRSKLTLADKNEREEQIKMVKEWLRYAMILGAPELRVFAGITPDGYTDQQAFEWAVASLKECVPFAAKHGVVMALENHGGITRTSSQVIQLIEAVNSEWLRVNLDTGNYGLDPNVDPYEAMKRVAHLAVTAHHKVSMKTLKGHVLVDINKVVKILKNSDYKGYLNIEFEEDEDPKLGVPKVVKEIKNALLKN